MKRRYSPVWLLAVLCWPLALEAQAGDPFTWEQDVIYGRKDGMALTLDVFTPREKANHAAVVWIVSGGLKSSREAIQPILVLPFLVRGYTVFAVVHSSQPKYSATEVLPDICRAVFDFRELDPKTGTYVPITDPKRRLAIGRQVSPVYYVTKDDAPTLIIHGDADTLVPIQQSESILARFNAAGVPAKLIVKPGVGHGWPTILLDLLPLADWFDQYL